MTVRETWFLVGFVTATVPWLTTVVLHVHSIRKTFRTLAREHRQLGGDGP